jgi:hypothetical protein
VTLLTWPATPTDLSECVAICIKRVYNFLSYPNASCPFHWQELFHTLKLWVTEPVSTFWIQGWMGHRTHLGPRPAGIHTGYQNDARGWWILRAEEHGRYIGWSGDNIKISVKYCRIVCWIHVNKIRPKRGLQWIRYQIFCFQKGLRNSWPSLQASV